jgi:hypothetical protein
MAQSICYLSSGPRSFSQDFQHRNAHLSLSEPDNLLLRHMHCPWIKPTKAHEGFDMRQAFQPVANDLCAQVMQRNGGGFLTMSARL